MKQQISKFQLIFSFMIALIPALLNARDAPITTAGSSSLCPGGAVTVPVTVTNFTLVKAISLRLDYNPTQISFVNTSNLNPALAGAAINMVVVNATLNKIMIAWSSITALNLINGSKLLDLNFTLVSGTPTVTFNNTDNSGGDCEYADENGNAMNDLPTANFYFNSTITNLGVAAAGTVTGTTTLCAGTNNVAYSVTPITNATGYIWTVPTGGTIVSGGNTSTIVVNYSTSAVSGIITVAGTNSCGTGTSSSLPVTIYPLPVPVINGLGSICAGSSGIIYTTSPGMTNYIWSVSGGTITAGAGTATVTVTWNTVGTQSISVNYTNSNLCSAASPAVKSVTVNPLPVPTITGISNMCVGTAGVSYTTEPAMTGYAWTVSAGGSITSGAGTNAIIVTWNTAGNQTVSVNYTNENSCTASAATLKNITVDPLPSAAGNITGTGNVCTETYGVAYATAIIPNTTVYLWTLPPGATIATGSGTNNITVNFGPMAVSGNIVVVGNNICGYGLPSPPFPVTVNPLPAAAGTITGPAIICPGATGISYSVPAIANATGYNWTVPPGALITSGASTNQIGVTFGPTPLSGVITVQGSNLCGNGPISPNFDVTVDTIPAPFVTAAGAVLTSSAINGNQWYYEETGAIPGATGQEYTAVKTGWYWASVSIYDCHSDTSNHVYVLFTGQQDIPGSGSVVVFPIPNDGRFTISIANQERESYMIRIYNQIGSLIYKSSEFKTTDNFLKTIDLRPIPRGIYTLMLQTDDQWLVRKLIVKW